MKEIVSIADGEPPSSEQKEDEPPDIETIEKSTSYHKKKQFLAKHQSLIGVFLLTICLVLKNKNPCQLYIYLR